MTLFKTIYKSSGRAILEPGAIQKPARRIKYNSGTITPMAALAGGKAQQTTYDIAAVRCSAYCGRSVYIVPTYYGPQIQLSRPADFQSFIKVRANYNPATKVYRVVTQSYQSKLAALHPIP
jgi:hypothetical protein